MAQYYVVALMETRKASNYKGVGYRSFWVCHSGPFSTREQAQFISNILTGEYGLQWRGTNYFLVDSFPVEYKELSVYGLSGKSVAMRTLLHDAGKVR